MVKFNKILQVSTIYMFSSNIKTSHLSEGCFITRLSIKPAVIKLVRCLLVVKTISLKAGGESMRKTSPFSLMRDGQDSDMYPQQQKETKK